MWHSRKAKSQAYQSWSEYMDMYVHNYTVYNMI